MKILLLIPAVLFFYNAVAQQQLRVKDSLTANPVLIKPVTIKNVPLLTTEGAIAKELDAVVVANINKTNTASTWATIKQNADNILLRYFKNGKLLGTKPTEAYYIKMGSETMTAADIAAGKMILVCGVATVKPAEFKIIRIEKSTK
jgi:phage tail sheath protein FI